MIFCRHNDLHIADDIARSKPTNRPGVDTVGFELHNEGAGTHFVW